MPNKKFFFAVAALVGTIIGAGIFAMPYAFAKAGLVPSLIVFGVLAGVNIVIMLMYGEVILRTPGIQHECTGYTGQYLGRPGRWLMLVVNLVGTYGALLVFIIGGSDFLRRLLGPSTTLSPVWAGVIFFVVCSALVVWGLRAVAKVDLVFMFLFIGVVGLITAWAAPKIQLANFATGDLTQILFPFGIIIFALTGATTLPMMNNLLRGQAHQFGKAIIWGGVIATIITLVFTIAILGLGGAQTTSDAIGTVQQTLPTSASLALAIFGLVALGTSFLSSGLMLRDMFMFDYRIKRRLAVVLVLLVPLGLFLLDLTGFVGTISFIGAVTGGLTGIIYVILYRQARIKGQRRPEFQINFPAWVQGTVLFVYVLAITYEVLKLF